MGETLRGAGKKDLTLVLRSCFGLGLIPPPVPFGRGNRSFWPATRGPFCRLDPLLLCSSLYGLIPFWSGTSASIFCFFC